MEATLRDCEVAPETKTNNPSLNVQSEPENVCDTRKMLSNLNLKERTDAASKDDYKGDDFLRQLYNYPPGKELEVPEFLKKYPQDPRYWMDWSFHNVKTLSETSDEFKRAAADVVANEIMSRDRDMYIFSIFSRGPLARYLWRFIDIQQAERFTELKFEYSMWGLQRKRLTKLSSPHESTYDSLVAVKRMKRESGNK
ncbi:hypothetical protein O6P43_000766 [Quillaja saponaria]|uniref:Uncharacterized protein n=1 Tax=Quillaja saponaria TaxID=32244 RepID=A0AAD7QHE1_QUISA|nr:hypothetical protein O6P43_000766 [Quillaja saponaria]